VGLALIGLGALAVVANSIAAGHILGDLLFLLGAVLWTGYALAFRRAGLAPWEAAGLVAIWSFLAVVPFGAPELIHSIAVAPAGAVLGQVFFQGLISGVVSLLAYTLAVSNLGPARATAITAIVPVTAGLAAIVFLGEDITLVTATGATVTTLGVLFASGAFKAPFARD
jgi:drug/metabolite transporter (DMT)-like permease